MLTYFLSEWSKKKRREDNLLFSTRRIKPLLEKSLYVLIQIIYLQISKV